MTSKRFSIKNLIFTFALLLLAVVTSVAGSNSIVFADARDSAKAEIDSSYTAVVERTYGGEYLVNENNYNAKELLDKIKAEADYNLNLCDEAEIDTQKDQYLEKIDIINDFISIGESLRAYVDGKSSGNYTTQNWSKIKGYLNSFLDLLNIDSLYKAGNLNREYLENTIGDENSGEYKSVKTKIDNVTKIQIEITDIEALRQRQIQLMQEEFNKYEKSGFYDNVAEMRLLLDNTDADNLGAKQQINAANTEGEINDIRSDFITTLHNNRTIVEKTYDKYVYYSTESSGHVPSDVTTYEISQAISVYQLVRLAMQGDCFIDSSKFAYVSKAGTRLLAVYVERKTTELEGLYEWTQYSKRNITKINKLKADAIADMKAVGVAVTEDKYTETIDKIVKTAKEEIEKVPRNVQTIKTCEGNVSDYRKSKYTVTITSSNPYAFDPEAYVVARDYDYYAVKTNVNRMLRRIDAGKNSDGKDLTLVVKYYIDITIYDEIVFIDGAERSREFEAPKDDNGNYVDTYVVTIVMDDKFAEAVGDEPNVIYYYNGQMEGYSKDQDGNYTLDNTQRKARNDEVGGQKVLMFETNHFSPYAVCGTTVKDMLLFNGPIYKNPFFYIAVILVTIILIVLSFILVKHCKYKLVFVNNGGTRVALRKFKNKEPIEMPTINPTKKGYVFGGWFADKHLKTRFTQTVMRRRNLKVYAKWVAIEGYNLDDVYKALKSCLNDYERVGLSVGFSKEDKIARIILSNDKVLLYLGGDASLYEQSGLIVEKDNYPENEGINNKFTVRTDEDLEKALDCIEICMAQKNMMEKEGDPVLEEISAEERANGFLLAVTNDKVVESLKDYLELMRIASKSYVLMGDGGTPRDLDGKYIVKAKLNGDSIKLYLPYESEGAEKVTDALYKDVPYMYTVTDGESCEKALKVIGESMEYIGMTKYPRNAKLLKGAGDEENSFGYKIKFN